MPGRRSSLPPLLLAVALVATACLGADGGAPATPATPATTSPPTTGPADVAPAEAAFLDAMGEHLSASGYAGSVPDDAEALLRAGSSACELLERGLTVDDLLLVLAVTLDLGAESSVDDVVLAASLVDAATTHLCP
jgi:hypothetical protein